MEILLTKGTPARANLSPVLLRLLFNLPIKGKEKKILLSNLLGGWLH